jgi:DNA polymerase (family 10)
LDFVIGSMHSAFNLTREQQTQRLIRACENPYVNVIGHPTGRRIDGLVGVEFDYDVVFAAAARTGTAMEIDGQAVRLDLPSPLAARARSFGVTFTVDSDAHGPEDLPDIELGVGQARRAGLEARDILNCRPLDEVLAFVAAKRPKV